MLRRYRLSPVVLNVVVGVAPHAHRFPNPRRLIGTHARATQLVYQQPARGQGIVADHFAIHPETRAARQQPVGHILLQLFRRGRGRLAIDGRSHQQAEEFLDVPARLAELDRHPIEQLGMRGQFAADPQVAGGADQPRAEQLLPETIDRHSRGHRLFGPQQPLSQAQPIARQLGWHRRQRGRSAGRDLVAALVVVAPIQDERRRRFRPFLHHVGDRAAGLDLFFFVFQAGKFAIQLDRRLVQRGDPPAEDFGLFRFAPLLGRLGHEVGGPGGLGQLRDFRIVQGPAVNPQVLNQGAVDRDRPTAVGRSSVGPWCGSNSSAGRRPGPSVAAAPLK